MNGINSHKAGLALGAFTGGFHLFWSILVALGWAQPVLDFIFQIHMLNNPYVVQAFGWKRAATLVVVTFLVGYVAGRVLGVLWNKFHR